MVRAAPASSGAAAGFPGAHCARPPPLVPAPARLALSPRGAYTAVAPGHVARGVARAAGSWAGGRVSGALPRQAAPSEGLRSRRPQPTAEDRRYGLQLA